MADSQLTEVFSPIRWQGDALELLDHLDRGEDAAPRPPRQGRREAHEFLCRLARVHAFAPAWLGDYGLPIIDEETMVNLEPELFDKLNRF